jgi:hypothetical protein
MRWSNFAAKSELNKDTRPPALGDLNAPTTTTSDTMGQTLYVDQIRTLCVDRTLFYFLVDPHLSDISPIPIPIVFWPPFRKSRVSGQSVLVPANSFTLAIQVAQAVDVTVALGCVRTVHGFLAKDYCFCVRSKTRQRPRTD